MSNKFKVKRGTNLSNITTAPEAGELIYKSDTNQLFVGNGSTAASALTAIGGTGTVDTSGTPIAQEYARFTDANTIEGRSAAGVRTDLGLNIGTNVQAQDDLLQDIADFPTSTPGNDGKVVTYQDSDGSLVLSTPSVGTITSVSGMTDNNVLTASGSTTISGESNLTFSSLTLQIPSASGKVSVDTLVGYSNNTNTLLFNDDQTSANNQVSLQSINHINIMTDGNNNGTGNFKVWNGSYDVDTADLAFQVNSSSNATFYGDLTISGTGDLTVPGVVKHTGDSDTYIFFTNDRIRLYAGNTLKLDTDETYLTAGLQTALDGKVPTSRTISGVGLTGTGSLASNRTFTVDYLAATDDRDVKPNAITTSGRKQVRAYFTSLEGLTGTAGSDWQDLLVLSTYSDGSGGDMNALAFDKSTQQIRHYLADQSATTWGTAKTIAYTDSTMTGTWQGTPIANAYIADNSINAAKLDVSGNGSNGQVLKSDGDGTFSWFTLVSSSNASTLDNLDSTQFLRSDANDTASGQYSFTKVNDHAIKVGTIRGTTVGSQSGEYIHMYNKVHIGSPSGWGSRSAPTYGLSTYGGADLATDTGDVTIGGNLKLTREKGLLWDYTPNTGHGGYIAHPGGGMYRTSTGSHTGALTITIPSGGGPADMISFWVDVFDYVSYESQSFYIAGYVYQTAGSNEWVNETAMMLTPKENHARTVRFGHNGTNHVVYIGELADTWSYPQVTVRNVQVGFNSDVDTYDDNWDISFEASAFANVDATYSGADTLLSAGKIKMADGAGKFVHNTTSSRDKIRVWNSSAYAIGMQSPNNYGGLVNQYAMTFSMDSTSNRGFLWVKNTHSQSQGAMALTTDGKATIAHSLRLGYGESDTTTPGGTATLETKNSGTGLAGYFENTSSNGTVMQLKTTGDNSSLYLQTDHIYGSGSLHLGAGTNQNIYRGSSHTFQVGSGNTTNMTLNSNQLLFAQPTRLQFANDQRIFDNGSGGLSVGAESHELRLYSGGTDPIEFRGGGRNGTTRCTITHDGQFTWGSAADYGRLTWDTGKAIISSQGSNNLEIRRVNTSDMISLEDNDIRFIADGTERFAANQNGLDLSAATANKIVHTAYGSRDKYRVWNSSYYCIGMDASYTFGGIGSDYVMTFQMNDSPTRGFWWGDDQHTDAQGAMSLTTNGKLAVAHSVRLGYGESDTTTPGATYRLDVSGNSLVTGTMFASTLQTDSGNLNLSGGGWGMNFYIDNDSNSSDNYNFYSDNALRHILGGDGNVTFGKVANPTLSIMNTATGAGSGPTLEFGHDQGGGLRAAAIQTYLTDGSTTNRTSLLRLHHTQNNADVLKLQLGDNYVRQYQKGDTSDYLETMVHDDYVEFHVAHGSYAQITTDSGYVGIGPRNSSWCHFYTDRAAYYFDKTVTAGNGIVQSYNNGAGSYDLDLRRAQSTDDRIVIEADQHSFYVNGTKRLEVKGNGTVQVNGTLNATSDVVAYFSSDKRLKDNLKPIENSLDKVSKLSGYEFDWNDKQKTYQGHDIGVVAQEVEKVLPELVATREDGYKAVKYEKIVPLLIEAIKEQQQQINELKEKLNG